MIIVLVGNKTDLSEKREVTAQQGEEESKRLGCMFVETSAKVGHNVKGLFKKIAQALPGMEGEGQQGPANSECRYPSCGDLILITDVRYSYRCECKCTKAGGRRWM